MAKLAASAAALLAALVTAAGSQPGYLFVDPTNADAVTLTGFDPKLAELNADVKNPKNKTEVAIRVTDAGKTFKDEDAPAAAAKPTFKIVTFELPKIERKGGGGGNRKSKYPTDDLQPGQAFFIESTPEVKSMSKTYGSIASSANKKYGNLTAGADFRYFETRAIADGAPFGDEFKGKSGLAIGRLSVAAASAKRDDLIANPPKPRAKKTATA